MNVFEWYGKFHNGRERVDDDLKVVRPQTCRTPEHITKVCPALADDRHSTLKMLAKWFHIDKKPFVKLLRKI